MSPSSFCRHLLLLSLLADLSVPDFQLLIVHVNDIRGRYIEVYKKFYYPCTIPPRERCLGGLPRMSHYVKKIKKKAKNVLFLFAGNVGAETIWYDVADELSQKCVNALGFDAVSVGALDVIMPSYEYFTELKPPIVSCNLAKNPNIILNVFKPSITIDMDGMRVGIIGFTGHRTEIPLNKYVDFDHVCIREEIDKLQREGVKILILLIDADLNLIDKLMEDFPELDVIVFSGNAPLFYWHNNLKPDLEPIHGHYPPIKVLKSKKRIPFVTTSGYSKYVGKLFMTFDDQGEAKRIGGSVVILNGEEDKEMAALIDTYRSVVKERAETVVGNTAIFLDYKNCLRNECALGNIVTSSYNLYMKNINYEKWNDDYCNAKYIIPVLIMGADIQHELYQSPPPTTIEDLYMAFPYYTQIFLATIPGYSLLGLFESSVREAAQEIVFPNFLQSYGIKVTFDMSKPTGYRVVELKIRECDKKWYHEVEYDQNYDILTTGSIAKAIEDTLQYKPVPMGRNNINVMEWYYKHFSPVTGRVEGKIRFLGIWNFTEKVHFRRCLLVLTLMTISL